jgi:PAS domain S-box-containing protein
MAPVKSIQTLFLAAITLLIVVLSVPLLLSGVQIITDQTSQFGTEILTEKLHALVEPIDRRYQTLARVGLEDSAGHRQEIKESALQNLAAFRYKATGTVFVINANRSITLSRDFSDPDSPLFADFFAALGKERATIAYQAAGHERIGAVRYYPPWDAFIGLAMDRDELFAPRARFVRLNLVVLAVVVLIALLFTLAIHHFLITPLLRLSRFAGQVSTGNLEAEIPGRFILELAVMKEDIIHMVATLISREEKYRAVFNAPGDAIFIHERASGRIIEVNQAVGEMYGYSPQETLGMHIGDLSSGRHPYTLAEASKRVSAITTAEAQRFEWQARRKNGELFWVDVALRAFDYGHTPCVLAVVRDIEAQKRAALELAAEKERLAITLRSIGDGVITTDDKGCVVLVNRVAERLTGWSQQEAAGRPLAEVLTLVEADSGDRCPDPAQAVLRCGCRLELAQHTVLVGRDNSRTPIADSAAPIYDPRSAVVGVVLVFRDITEKLRTEQEQLKIKKLESVGVLAGGIAHDFNNLLTAILGNINLARLAAAPDSQLARLLTQAEKGSLRAQHLTQQLLTFAKGGEPVRQAADLGDIIRDNADFVLRGSAIGFSFNPPADLWPVDIDPGQIGQVIQNIILNARQALPLEGGRIEVLAQNCPACLPGSGTQPAPCVRLTITDNGPGIPPEHLDKIFDPYFTTKEAGSGLGLAICHAIITKHKGVLTVQTTEGSGTEFTLKLPVATGPPAQAATSERPPSQRRLKILVMDDEEMLRTLALDIFALLGHEAQAVPDGDAALVAYQQAMAAATPFDLVIMDLTIPGGMGGKEAVKKILALNPQAKVIVASGYSNDPVMANYQKYGFAAMLVKPYLTRDLEEVIHHILP